MAKAAKLASQARLSEAASPLAALTRFDSAMPTLKKRSGNFLAKKSVRVELWTSPSSTTMSRYCSPIFASAMPNASRTDFPIFMVVSSLVRSAGELRALVWECSPLSPQEVRPLPLAERKDHDPKTPLAEREDYIPKSDQRASSNARASFSSSGVSGLP